MTTFTVQHAYSDGLPLVILTGSGDSTVARTHSRNVIAFIQLADDLAIGGRLAVRRTVTLCEHCYRRFRTEPGSLDAPRLGPVSRYLHRGGCDVALRSATAEWAERAEGRS